MASSSDGTTGRTLSGFYNGHISSERARENGTTDLGLVLFAAAAWR